VGVRAAAPRRFDLTPVGEPLGEAVAIGGEGLAYRAQSSTQEPS